MTNLFLIWLSKFKYFNVSRFEDDPTNINMVNIINVVVKEYTRTFYMLVILNLLEVILSLLGIPSWDFKVIFVNILDIICVIRITLGIKNALLEHYEPNRWYVIIITILFCLAALPDFFVFIAGLVILGARFYEKRFM